MRRLVSAFVVGPMLLLGGTAAMALGMGRVNTLSDLGSPLDFSVALSAEPSDALDLDCIRAEVYAGDARVPPEMVRLRLTRRADGTPVSLRVSTGMRMDEPLANVEITLDCGVRVSRRYVVFIDPPQLSLAQAGGAAVAAGAVAATQEPSARDLSAAPPSRRARSTRPAGEDGSTRTVRRDGTGVTASAARQRRAEAAAAARQARAAARAEAQAQAPADSGSRLKLESAAPTAAAAPLRERAAAGGTAAVGAAATGAAAAALQSAASAAQTAAAASAAAASAAASSAIAAASAASGAVGGLLSELAAKAEADAQALNAERLRSLEESLARLRSDNQTMQKSMAELQARLQEAEAGRYANPLVYGLLGLLGLLLIAVIALLWRQAGLRKESEWLRAAATQGDGPGLANPPQPAVRSVTLPSGAAVVRAGGAAAAAAVLAGGAKARAAEAAEPAAVVDDEPGPGDADASTAGPAVAAVAATLPLAASPNTTTQAGAALRPHEKTSIHDPRREVSVEELIDLEQQADFFVVLGQDEAAVELLMGHVQGTGGASPLPYLKLLEIHRRRDERAAYDEVRERFNRRFSAFAPEWDAHSGHDRSLEGYPAVIERLQAVWREPTLAMDELAALLFQRDPTAQTFDLPAYGELLFLYSLARELAEDPDAPDGVDLLLPLDDLGPDRGGARTAGLAAGGAALAAAAVAAAPAAGAAERAFASVPGLDELPSIPSLPEQPGTYPAPLAYDPPEPREPGPIDFDSDLLDLNISDEPEEPKGPLSKY